MKNFGDRIFYEQIGKNELEIEIKPLQDKSKNLQLKLWLFAWSFCGLVVLYAGVFEDFGKDEKLFMGVYLILWAYFEFKVLSAYRYQKNGVEKVTIKDGEFTYVKEVSGRGLPLKIPVDKLYKFKYQNETERGFWNDINRSIWMVGGEVVEFAVNGAIRRLGMKLTKKEAEKVVSLINKTAQL